MAFESWKARAEELEAEVYALYLAFRDSRTPLAAKGVIALIVAYAVSPVDPIPDFVPGLGYLDEIFVLPVGVAVALRLVPDDLMDECRARADDEIDVGRARWVVAAVVVLLWGLAGLLALRAATGWL
ncbi:MAG: YkvA family protein [Haloferacaceae archaeon]